MARLSFRRLLGPKLPMPSPLHVCVACGDDFVSPSTWSFDTDGNRRVTLRCGACGHAREAAVTPTTAALLEVANANRLARLAETADQLERERMTRWVESFTGALANDLIDATDF